MRTSRVVLAGVGASQIIPVDWRANPPTIYFDTVLTGTAWNYDIEATCDDVFAPGYNPAAGNWFDIGGLTGLVAAIHGLGNGGQACTAVRINAAANDGTITLLMHQAGGYGAN